jgi:anthranilate synthase/aminodeoxychorismate synthase-like glutamine amidotransferase
VRILLIDNYDSFTYNLVQRIGELALGRDAVDMHVVRNDRIAVADAAALEPTHLILSPGPCTPRETGICPELIRHFRARIPILGVCLGHQTIADVHGMVVRRHSILMHGKTSEIHHDGRGIYTGLSNPFTATRYHSLIVDRATLRPEFQVSAWTEAGEIMGIRWAPAPAPGPASGNERSEAKTLGAPMDGVQFHPESFLTVEGPRLLANFLGLVIAGPPVAAAPASARATARA